MVDAEQLQRARVWADTFALEQVAAALDNGGPAPVVEQVVSRLVGHLRREGLQEGQQPIGDRDVLSTWVVGAKWVSRGAVSRSR